MQLMTVGLLLCLAVEVVPITPVWLLPVNGAAAGLVQLAAFWVNHLTVTLLKPTTANADCIMIICGSVEL